MKAGLSPIRYAQGQVKRNPAYEKKFTIISFVVVVGWVPLLNPAMIRG